MPRRVFFSFRYKEDNYRAGIVRNSYVTQGGEAAGFFNSFEWEEVKKKDDAEVRKWIDGKLEGTSVTVLLIGADTAGKKWINYEIAASRKKGNGIVGIYVHKLKDKDGNKSEKGRMPLDDWSVTRDGKLTPLSAIYKTYDWVGDEGDLFMWDWIEAAAEAADTRFTPQFRNTI